MKWFTDNVQDQSENLAPAHSSKRSSEDYCRCQDHYLHGDRILQRQVQIKFLEAPFASLVFPWVQGCGGRSFGSTTTTTTTQKSWQLWLSQCVLSQGAFPIIRCWPPTKLPACFVTLNVHPLTGVVQFVSGQCEQEKVLHGRSNAQETLSEFLFSSAPLNLFVLPKVFPTPYLDFFLLLPFSTLCDLCLHVYPVTHWPSFLLLSVWCVCVSFLRPSLFPQLAGKARGALL